MTDIRGVLWDMDGVLVDTVEYHFQAWKEILNGCDKQLTREEFTPAIGKNNRETLRMLLSDWDSIDKPEDLFIEKELAFRESIQGRAQLLPGVDMWLRILQDVGVRQAIASSAPIGNVDVLVDELQIRDYFLAICSGSGLPSKPHPAVFFEASRLIDVEPKNCVVIEDSRVGVIAAKRAAMRCIAVTTSYPARDLDEADHVVESLETLILEDLLQ
jgi:beta-phosphoglucomutase